MFRRVLGGVAFGGTLRLVLQDKLQLIEVDSSQATMSNSAARLGSQS